MKIALLFGLNYKGTNSELRGCINDANLMATKLKDDFNYQETRVFTDDSQIKPLKENIISELEKLIIDSVQCTEIFFHFSGHGGFFRDKNNDEKDGYDEVIYPLDYSKKGIIKDDELNKIIVKTKCDLRIIMDCCNSGSNMDLYHSVQIKNKNFLRKTEMKIGNNENNILMLSGSPDDDLAYDIYSSEREKFVGALTSTFLDIHKKAKELYKKAAIGYKMTRSDEPNIQIMLEALYTILNEKRIPQRPVFSSNKNINLKGIFLSNKKGSYMPLKLGAENINLQIQNTGNSGGTNGCSGGCVIQ